MISKSQEIERLNKVKEIIKVIWTSNSIKEISIKTKIPTSTIQRYLNNNSLLKEAGLFENDILRIKKWLIESKIKGLSKGGKTTQDKYKDSYTRIENGKYSGIKKK